MRALQGESHPRLIAALLTLSLLSLLVYCWIAAEKRRIYSAETLVGAFANATTIYAFSEAGPLYGWVAVLAYGAPITAVYLFALRSHLGGFLSRTIHLMAYLALSAVIAYALVSH